jgi:hypothetical protein
MKLKGIVKIEVIDVYKNTKELVIKENLIPDDSWLGILGDNASFNYFGSRRISIATDTSTPVATVSSVTGVIGTCSTPFSVTSPTWVENVDPPYGTITGQISPTGVSRTFNSVALTGLGAGGTQAVASTRAYARLLLDIPCTQGINDFVNITYSIQFLDNVGDGIIDKDINRYDMGRALFGFGQYRISVLYYSVCSPNYNAVKLPAGNIQSSGWNTTGVSNDNFKWNYLMSKGKPDDMGVIYNAMPQGVSNNGLQSYALGKYEYNNSPIQTGFKHSSGSLIPFFDSVNIANSQGSAILGGAWTGKFPEYYRIDFTGSGATGVATYKFRVFKHVGFFGNSYGAYGRDNDCLYTAPGLQVFTGSHGWRDEDFDKHRLSNTEIVQYDSTGVTQLDVITGVNKTWDATTTPSLPCTSIRQVAVDTTNRLIYVACRNTGLWVIDIGANTTTNELNNPCYGVDVGRNNIAVAIIGGGIYRSDDGFTTPKTFTYSGITTDWSRVKFLKADPEHANDRIAIVADNGSGSINRVVWHEFSSNTSTTGRENNTIPGFCAGLDVCDTGSLWVYFDGVTNSDTDLRVLVFNSASITFSYNSIYKGLAHSVFGSRKYSKVAFCQDNLIIAARSVSAIGDAAVQLAVGAYNGYIGGQITPFNTLACLYVIHLDSGICLIHGVNNGARSTFRQIFMGDNAKLVTSYGWDGSAWVAGNVNSKTTHSSTDELINGLTIRFVDGATAPHFISGEFQTQGVNTGLLKDNATDLTWRSAWYSKTIHNDTISSTTIASTVTLPATSDPYFRKLDTDPIAIPHRFYIDGVLATKIWVNGTAPAATEVSMLANGNGVLTFNAADVGKTLTGSYVWIEV